MMNPMSFMLNMQARSMGGNQFISSLHIDSFSILIFVISIENFTQLNTKNQMRLQLNLIYTCSELILLFPIILSITVFQIISTQVST